MHSLEIPEGFLAESLRIPWEIPLGIPLDSARNAKGILKDSLGNPMDSLGIPWGFPRGNGTINSQFMHSSYQ